MLNKYHTFILGLSLIGSSFFFTSSSFAAGCCQYKKGCGNVKMEAQCKNAKGTYHDGATCVERVIDEQKKFVCRVAHKTPKADMIPNPKEKLEKLEIEKLRQNSALNVNQQRLHFVSRLLQE